MSVPSALAWLGLALLSGGLVIALSGSIGLRRRPSWVAGLLAFAAILSASLVLHTGFRPRPVEVRITRPSNGAKAAGYKLRVEGTARPSRVLVTLVVRSESDDRWWVQDVVQPDPATGRWAIESYLGTPEQGGGENFYIVALASADGPLTNFLLSRRLRPGMVVRAMPRWNQAEPLVVRRRP